MAREVVVVRIETLDRRPGALGNVLSDRVFVAASIGAALDRHAPDPADGTSFRVTMLERAAEVLDAE